MRLAHLTGCGRDVDVEEGERGRGERPIVLKARLKPIHQATHQAHCRRERFGAACPPPAVREERCQGTLAWHAGWLEGVCRGAGRRLIGDAAVEPTPRRSRPRSLGIVARPKCSRMFLSGKDTQVA